MCTYKYFQSTIFSGARELFNQCQADSFRPNMTSGRRDFKSQASATLKESIV